MEEEQEMEIEALQAIYDTEMVIISDTTPRKFSINVSPDGDIDEETTTSQFSF